MAPFVRVVSLAALPVVSQSTPTARPRSEAVLAAGCEYSAHADADLLLGTDPESEESPADRTWPGPQRLRSTMPQKERRLRAFHQPGALLGGGRLAHAEGPGERGSRLRCVSRCSALEEGRPDCPGAGRAGHATA